jgi:putative ABC transport system permease protein
MEILSLIRAGARGLVRRPAYTLLVTATLAVGIGGTTSVFSLVNGALLESIPYDEPDRLVTLDVTAASTGFGISLSIPHYMDWRERNRVFSHFGASAGWSFVHETTEGARLLDGRAVLGDFFAILGMETALGRTLTAEETEAGAAPQAVLGHGFWLGALGGDPAIVGRSVNLDDTPFEVVGVLAPGEGYPRPDVDLYTPMGQQADRLPWDVRGSSFGTQAVARLADGMTVEQAQADMDRVVAEVDAEVGADQVTAGVRTLEDFFLGDVRQGIWVLMGAVMVVLLIAGANVANLALARGESRAGELAVRRALGAGRDDLLRLLLAESLWLAAVGGSLGVGLAYAAVGALPSMLPLEVPALVSGQIGVDASVLAFALAVSLGAGLLFGMAPALQAWRGTSGPGDGMRNTAARSSKRFRGGLVVSQVALSVVLLVGAGLLLRSLGALASVEKGFDEGDVLTARLSPPRGLFDGREPWLAFYNQVLASLEASPDVEHAATTLLIPLSGSSWERRVRSETGPVNDQEQPSFLFNIVSEGYFETLGIPLVRGRAFESGDTEGAPLVAVVDERMAEHFWPGQDPIGRQVSWRDTPDGGLEWRTVVGVAANTRHYELANASRIQAYVPMRQAGPDAGVGLRVAVKTRGDAALVTQHLRRTVAELQPGVPVSQERMLAEYVADELGTNRAMGTVTSAFGVVAALLAALGIFGVLSLTVARRAREIGVRMAIGATRTSVVRLVARQGLTMAVIGAGAGLVVSALTARVLEAFLYQVEPLDPLVYAGSAAILLAAAVVAVTQPALRAARTSPSRVLREE